MTYTDRYNVIIHYFQRHPIDKTKIYCEYHHILPRSCGGSNDKENLVNLPAAWHYRVHCYLPFVMLEQNNEVGYIKMIHAWKRCLNSNKDRIDLMKINEESREYKRLREEFAKEIGKKNAIRQLRENNSHFNHHWWKDPNDKTKSRSIKEGDPVPKGWVRGRWITDEQKQKSGKAVKGKIEITDGIHTRFINSEKDIPNGWHRGIPERSKEAREKMSLSAKEQGKRYREKMTPIMREKLLPLFECFYSEGFKAVKEKFGYKYTVVNLCQQFRKYLPKEYSETKHNHNQYTKKL